MKLYECRATSATSHVVLGQFKTCVILLGGYLLFGSDPGIVSICGAIAALFGMSVYTILNVKESREKATTEQLLKPPPLKLKSAEGNKEDSKPDHPPNAV